MMILTDISDGNLAYHANFKNEDIDKNREILAKKCGFDIKQLRYMNQTHGNNVQIVDYKSPILIDDCDALITKEKDLPIMVMVADCIPIYIEDKTNGAIAVVHGGRNSTFLNILEKTINKMIDEFSCNVENISVYFGPSIQKCCYEVSNELATIVTNSFGQEFEENRFIDLQGISKMQLKSLGVENIEISDICTKCSEKPYFSYRNNKKTGRFSIIAINKSV